MHMQSAHNPSYQQKASSNQDEGGEYGYGEEDEGESYEDDEDEEFN